MTVRTPAGALSEAAVRTYGALRRWPGTTAPTVASLLGLDPTVVAAAIGELRDAGLARHDQAGGLTPVDPYLALQSLINDQQEDLLRRQRWAEQARRAHRLVSEVLLEARLTAGTPLDNHCLPAEPAPAERIRELILRARHSVRVIAPASLLAEGCPWEVYRQLAQRGDPVRLHLVVTRAALADRGAHRALTMLAQEGAHLRVVDRAPLSSALVDDAAAVAVVSRRQRADVVAYRDSSVVQIFQSLFDHLWSGGDMLPSEPLRRVRERPEPAGMSMQQRHVLRMLACGTKDESVARHLGVSLRTVRRIVAEAMAELGAQSRFEAGVIAARRGLLDCPAPVAGEES